MRGRPSSLGIVLTSAVCFSVPVTLMSSASCGNPKATTAAPTLVLAPSIVGPKDIIARATAYRLEVYSGSFEDAGAACGPSGKAVGDVSASNTLLNETDTDHQVTCGAGYTRCFLASSLSESPTSPRIFAVTAYSDNNAQTPIAYGCTSKTLEPMDAAVTQLSLSITLIPIQVCGDSVLEPPETCDPPATSGDGGVAGTTEECNASCQTQEELLSSGSGASGSITLTGAPGDKSNPSFVWPGSGGTFSAFFTDVSSGESQVSMRLMSSTLAEYAALGDVVETESIYLPNTASVFPATPAANNQKQPVAVELQSGLTYVAFADDTNNTGANDDFSISIRSIDGMLNPQQNTACVVGDTSNGESGSQTFPAMAVATLAEDGGSEDVLFIAWQDDSGRIFGRTYTPNATGGCGTLGVQSLLSTGSNNSHVAVAGLTGGQKSGWVAVWQSGSDIVVAGIGPGGGGGQPKSLAQTGHTEAAPSIASLSPALSSTSAGAFAIAWADQLVTGNTTTIYAERFDSAAVNSDASAIQLSQSTTQGQSEVTPFVAASSAVTGSFVVTWADAGSSAEVHARMLAAAPTPSGDPAYLTNAVDGTTGEFIVSDTNLTNRTRVSPTVVVGGAGYMAFGWADNTATAPYGIVARRFPLPVQ